MTAALTESEQHGEYSLIPLDLIDEPELPQRETMEQIDLGELALNIREVGLIQALTVKHKGDRFEVVAGHRRLLACRIVKYSPVPCIIKDNPKVDHAAILDSENAYREDVNPVEQARYYDRLLREQCSNDVDLLCIKVRRKRPYVEDRLLMLQWPAKVLAAVHEKKISMSVGRELSKVTDPNRLLILLDVSVTQGATARQVAEWRSHGEAMGPIGQAPETDLGPENQAHRIPATTGMECFFCGDSEFPHMMEFLYLHKYCKAALNRMIEQRAAGQAPSEVQ